MNLIMASSWLPLLVLLSSLVPGLIIVFLEEERVQLRTALNITGAVAKIVFVALMLYGVTHGHTYAWSLPVMPGLRLNLVADPLALLFVALSAALWLVTTIYAIGYLEGSPNRSRFFAFFSLCVTATAGIALAGDLFTFIVFYEALTWATYPLVVHRGTPASVRAGRTYLAYTITGGTVLLVGIVWLYALTGTVTFVDGGFVEAAAGGAVTETRIIFGVLIAGLAVKAAIVPLHGWLPVAMVAPAPVSALLHAVAVVKAGAFGIVRILYSVYGVEYATLIGAAQVLAVAAGITIIYGSLRALAQDDLKKRLAYSTVSQVSYITLGVAIVGPVATLGGLVHLMHQGIMKITLFFCAGNLAEVHGVKKVSELAGAGRRMPFTMAAFTIAAFGMIGLPPTAGFISKLYLGIGAVQAEHTWIVGVLVVSSMLNAAYFLPIVYRAWFEDAPTGATMGEAPWKLLVPAAITAALSLGAGLFAAMPVSPLELARLIIQRRYGL
ncbi:MAG TPA: proton-conducting transporter membrane subunit [Longimicrobiales bacterium]|nr:proton-conducting transporter membrane subunit [Longimicrobiales bacterium]